jgi:nucleotide-binding universal stress UspA family protein
MITRHRQYEEMTMKVLVAVDKSPESHMALAYTCHLLDHFDAEVHALYVKPDEVDVAAESFYAPFFSKDGLKDWLDSDAVQVEKEAIETCEYCLAGKIPCHPMIATGDPAEEILQTAREGDYDMIVLGSHGHSALRGFLLGTVHAKILHHTRRPVLIARDYREIKRVLIAYRGSQCDQDALRFVGPLLARKKPRITMLHIEENGRDEETERARTCLLHGDRTLQQLGHEPDIKTATGGYVDEVLKEVKNFPYDLVILGAYGHSKPRFLRMISDEALNLVRSTTRPVLVFRDKTQP